MVSVGVVSADAVTAAVATAAAAIAAVDGAGDEAVATRMRRSGCR